MKRIRFLIFSSIFLTLFLPPVLFAEDLNDIAYESRIHLNAGTIWNEEGEGDCLIFPYYDARMVGGKRQTSQINIENFGEYGITAKLRFRDWARGREVFSKDIWIPSKGVWNAGVEMSEDGTNALITSSGNVIWRYDSKTFYFANALVGGVSFSMKNIRKGLGESTLYGFIEVIGEEKTSPDDQGGKTGRLANIERDCPNTLRGTLSIVRVEDGATMTYDAVAVGNFSRRQGSLFRKVGSPYPRLDTGEDTLDQLEFQLSKYEVFGPFSVAPSDEGKTSLIVTLPTRNFHYSGGRRLKEINNPFEAMVEKQGETLKSSLSSQGAPLPADSEITLPFSVNVIGLYQGSGSPPTGIDNLSLPTYSYDSGEVKLTSNNAAQRILIQDYEYFKEMFTAYRGLPALGLILREYRNPDILHTSITPAEFSAVWEASGIESILFPTFVSGPSFGQVNKEYIFTTGGASSSVGHPIQYEIDWGDETTSGWLDVGVTNAKKTWTVGGTYGLRSRARCALHQDKVSKWSKELIVMIESVSPPSILNGPVTGLPNITYTYTTGGAVSNFGHPVQYLFDWGDGTDSSWLPVGVTTAAKSWVKGGSYSVKARARCATDPSVMSDFTPELVVTIELISTPITPIGPDKGIPGQSYTYMSGGASSNLNDPIEYQFDWGDGTLSPWLSSPTASKTWVQGGTFLVRVKARCAILAHNFVESAWSAALTVNIEKISKPTTPSGPKTGIPFTSYTYTSGGSTSNIGDPVEYQFDWGDGSRSGWIKPGQGNTVSASHSWNPGGTGRKFTVTVQARCAIPAHNYIESEPSDPLEVEIETVSAPVKPTSDVPGGGGTTTEAYTFATEGSTSSAGHPVEYQFDWGGGILSSWITPDADGKASVSHQFSVSGTYSVRARARCKTDPEAISDWSPALSVIINP
ncbi:MAG: hypothetical protein A2156_03520 [Deltaproteobacteria bacterium RBG_16_48_10]|nr:MAG: hypothetical protein A2156_03520 [Deltaproteobacteria bacterium RBG_16_48_10]